jgi:hypothetical protein
MINSNPTTNPTATDTTPSLVRIVPAWANKSIIDSLGPIDALDNLAPSTVEP